MSGRDVVEEHRAAPESTGAIILCGRSKGRSIHGPPQVTPSVPSHASCRVGTVYHRRVGYLPGTVLYGSTTFLRIRWHGTSQCV